ncbi:DNA polymerase Y family protein [Shinella kummerowiae]|uniref:DNA polymerase Y family protein n=1 Tax=Shinella kummerowiae TaxID=417745 RepID=UPI0021B5A81F|nr:DNA polymerase Y family protein [Shinella kummerowiae]MCT7664742.1 DNA polymerase Y family protein [Shinella kummerowiae]
MPRVVSLFLPGWPIDRLRRSLGASAPPPDDRLVLVGREGSRRIVTAVSRPAEQAGLRVGMPLTKAHALLPDVLTMPADPVADAAALNRLALWALQHYAPIVAPDPPDGLVIDTTGADHLHGGEERMLTGLVNRLGASGIFARAAIADTWGAAHAAARFCADPVCIIAPGATSDRVAPLPILGLRIPPDIVTGLHVLGFATIGDVLAVPRAPLVLRFGPLLGRRLDQLQGILSEPFDPLRDPELASVRKVFGEPIGAPETIARYTTALVHELCLALEKRGLGARRLDLLFHRVDNSVQAIRVGTAQPVRDEKRLTRLLSDRIETIDPGFGIEIMDLTATLAEPLVLQQAVSSLIEEEQADIAGLVDVIANRIGARRLYRMAPVESDVPERSVHRVAPLAPDDGATWQGRWPRPARLLARPEPIEVMALLPDHPPGAFAWRGVRRLVKRADGPERIFGEWWKRDAELAAVRDYFQVEDASGERFWLFRSGNEQQAASGAGRWFLHGIFA